MKKAISFKADFILGIGGGSVIDTAKGIAHGTANPDLDLWDIWTGKTPITKSLPVGAVLTIAAAGREMRDSAVLTNEAEGRKAGLNTPFNRAKFAVTNPELTFTLPGKQIACGVTDIMMHTLERYFITDVTCEMTDEIAEGLLRTVMRNGTKALQNQKDYDVMAEIMWCSSLSHNDLTGCGRGKDFSVHKMGQALGAKYDITHGETLSALWGSWARFQCDAAPDRFARYAVNVMGVSAQGKDQMEIAGEGIKKTEEYFKSLGMPVSLTELGVHPSSEEIHNLAMDATKQDTVKLSRLKPLTAAEVEKIYKLAQ